MMHDLCTYSMSHDDTMSRPTSVYADAVRKTTHPRLATDCDSQEHFLLRVDPLCLVLDLLLDVLFTAVILLQVEDLRDGDIFCFQR